MTDRTPSADLLRQIIGELSQGNLEEDEREFREETLANARRRVEEQFSSEVLAILAGLPGKALETYAVLQRYANEPNYRGSIAPVQPTSLSPTVPAQALTGANVTPAKLPTLQPSTMTLDEFQGAYKGPFDLSKAKTGYLQGTSGQIAVLKFGLVLTRKSGDGKLGRGDSPRKGKDHAEDPKDLYTRI